MTGFEPVTFCSQSRSATRLRYIPLVVITNIALILIKCNIYLEIDELLTYLRFSNF